MAQDPLGPWNAHVLPAAHTAHCGSQKSPKGDLWSAMLASPPPPTIKLSRYIRPPPREDRYAGLLGFIWLLRLLAAARWAGLFGFMVLDRWSFGAAGPPPCGMTPDGPASEPLGGDVTRCAVNASLASRAASHATVSS